MIVERIADPAKIPHSDEAERAVLASVLIDPDRWAPILVARLQPRDFFRESHGLILESISRLLSDGTSPDLLTVYEDLRTRGLEKRVGGLSYLTGIDTMLPDICSTETYIEIVADRAARRRLIELSIQAVRSATESEKSGVLLAQELAYGAIAVGSSGPSTTVAAGIAVERALELAEDACSNDNRVRSISTGLIQLDRISMGLSPGQLVIAAGRPGMGKSAFGLGIARLAAVAGRQVLVFSAEMSAEEIGQRLVAQHSGVPLRGLQLGQLMQSQWKAAIETGQSMAALPLEIDESASPSLQQVEARCQQRKARTGLDLVVIDYLGLMALSSVWKADTNNGLGEITRGLKAMAKRLGVSVLLLSQLSRETERRGNGNRPVLADLRGSGNIEQDADKVLFVYRPGYYEPDNEGLKGLAEVILAKHRNGETGVVQCRFDGPCTRFGELYDQPF